MQQSTQMTSCTFTELTGRGSSSKATQHLQMQAGTALQEGQPLHAPSSICVTATGPDTALLLTAAPATQTLPHLMHRQIMALQDV